MPDERSEVEIPGLSGLIANYLRDRRQRANLTQRQLADTSKGRAGRFDHSWVSQWEQRGPKPGMIKALTYLSAVGADFELLTEMLQLPIDLPEHNTEPSTEHAIKAARRAWNDGRYGAALGWSIWGARRAEDSGAVHDAAAAWLTFSIAARMLESYRVAEYSVARVLSFSGEEAGDESLMARAGIQAASLAAWRGNTAQADALLTRIERGPLAEAVLAAMVTHARAFVAATKGDAPSAADHYGAALAQYDGPDRSLTASLRVCLAMAQARLGRSGQAFDLLAQAAADASEESRFVQLVFEQVAGLVLMICGDYSRALSSLAAAEAKAKELQLWHRLFEINLTIYELAIRSKNAPLAALTRRRLRLQRVRTRLSARLVRAYEQLIPPDRPSRPPTP